jgi:uncharacterized membrane protein YvbJ
MLNAFKDDLGEVKCMPNLKNLASAQKSKISKSLFMKAKAFMHVAKKGDAFFVYALPTINVKPQKHEVSSQYKDYKNVFKKKNVDILPKHQPYDCTIDFKKGVQPHLNPFTICNKMNL